MKTSFNKKSKPYIFMMIIMTVSFLLSCSASAESGQKKNAIVLLPFSVISASNSGMISSGIVAILSSRLSEKGYIISPSSKTGPHSEKTTNAEDALRLASQLNGTHVVYGTVVKFGDTVTTDAFLIDTSSRETLIRFHDTGTGDDAVIRHVNAFTEKALSALVSPSAAAHAGDGRPNIKKELFQWKSRPFEGRINGIAVGDFKKDSHIECVVAFDSKIVIYTWKDNTIQETEVILFPKGRQVLGVDAADVNGNGIPEIFVSMVDSDNRSFSSCIIEWNGSTYTTIQSGLKWIFRTVMPESHGKPEIICQKHNALSGFLGGPVCFFEYKNGTYGPSLPVPGSGKIDVFSLTANLTKNDPLTACYDFRNRIKVVDKTGTIVWETEEQFGGGSLFLSAKSETDRDKIDRYYMEPRLLFSSLVSKESCDLIAIKNNESTRHLFTGIKNYSSGQIAVFSKNLTGFSKVYTTPPVSGYISDFSLFDVTGDKREKLIYTVVQGNNNFFEKQSSSIIIQELAFD